MLGLHQVTWLDGEREREMTLSLTAGGFELTKFKPQLTVPWSKVADIETGGPESIQKRMTVTRVALLGPLALAARKKTGETFAYISLTSGDQVVLKFEKMSEPQVRALFAPYRGSFVGGYRSTGPTVSDLEAQDAPAPAPAVDPLERLEKLAELHAKGILTADEFAEQKAKILAG